jgi:hypothetical protein
LFVGPPGYAPAIEMKVNYDTSPVTLQARRCLIPARSGMRRMGCGGLVGKRRSIFDMAGLTGMGQVGSVAMAFSLNQAFTLNQTDVIYEVGGMF